MTFDKHLDECKQCREHPFSLCPIGAEALKRDALALTAQDMKESAEHEKQFRAWAGFNGTGWES